MTTIIWFVLLQVQAQRQRTVFTPDEIKIGDCLKITGADGVAIKIPCPEPPPAEPFDVAPIWILDNLNERRMACADTSRFLMVSQDGKGHCLLLVKPLGKE